MKEQNDILSIENLSIGYKQASQDKVILEDINLTIKQPTFCALLGANGVGKSTLLRTIAGLQNALLGEIFIHGKSLQKCSKIELSKMMAIVLTEKPAMMNMRVYELVAMGRYPYTNWQHQLNEYDHQAVRNAIESTHISYIQEYPLYELSDGQLQKVMIARALAQESPIILLDEPTAHLDIANAWDILILLQKLTKQQQKTIIISTHQVEIAIEVCDQLWLADCGAPLHIGLTEDLILSGKLNQLYHQDGIHFDDKSGRFTLERKDLNLKVTGDSALVKWTKLALSKDNLQAKYPIQAAIIENKPVWIYEKEQYQSIEKLIKGIKKTDF